jgi:hypothetical protein
MNLVPRKFDSATIARGKIDKAVVIQNLFRRLSETGRPPEIFLNYSLDTRLYPMRWPALAEFVDNHPQAFESKSKFLPRPAAS